MACINRPMPAQVGARELRDGNMDPCPEPCEGFATAKFDLDACVRQRVGWGMFRDRRPDLYGALLSLDGSKGP